MTTMNMNKIADSLIENLPTREDVMNAIGLAARRSTSSDLATVIGVFGAGLLIGAGLALLFAPKSGVDLRRDLGERFSATEETAAGNPGVGGTSGFGGEAVSVGV